MNVDKKLLYTLSISTLAVLLLAFFLPGEYSGRIASAVLLLPLAIITHLKVKKRAVPSIHRRSVLMLISVISVVYLVIYYLSGLFFGFYKNIYFLNFGYLIPVTVIIILSEVIRFIMRSQDDTAADLLSYFSCIVAEALIFGNLYSITGFNSFMDFFAITLFPAVIANTLFHYLSKRYGILPNIVFRLVTTLYAYILPIISALPDAIFAFARLLVPVFIYLFIDLLYEKKRRYALKKKSKLTVPVTVLALAILTSFVLLISNQFRYGALVIATESMTGELNKGDVAIFDQKERQTYSEGQIIVFTEESYTVIHRIVKIERINGENRYYTQGDANGDVDEGYRTYSDIRGTVKAKVPYFGYPTLWLRELIKKTTS